MGEALHWWRVEPLDRPHTLRLRAEMRLPGRAWLELSALPADEGGARYRQRAVFEPHGVAGRLYWRPPIALFRNVVFGSMACNITGSAARQGPACRHRVSAESAVLTRAVAGSGWRRRAVSPGRDWRRGVTVPRSLR